MMIDRIIKYELCLGCGMCESLLVNKCEMKLNNKGFYIPVPTQKLTKQEEAIVGEICPGIHVETTHNEGVWGSMLSIAEAWSAEKEIRYKAASGGVVTSLAIYLLEHDLVDAILQVGVEDGSYLFNELKISKKREDVIKNAQSRYAPALVFNRIKQILDSGNDTYAFIGKPCDMAAVKNFIQVYPQYANRFKYFISIFCAGMPSYEATKKTWMQSGRKDEPQKLKYRGDGWPGNFTAVFKDGEKYEISYNESWGKVLNKHLPFRCKICPDGIGMLADIAVGDSWNTKDGYPDFTETDGKCFCMVRTEKGVELMNSAENAGYIEKKYIDVKDIKNQQKYQYERRKLTGWRLIPVQIMTGFILKFKGLGIIRQAISANFKTGIHNTKGTYLRLKKYK